MDASAEIKPTCRRLLGSVAIDRKDLFVDVAEYSLQLWTDKSA